MKKRIELIRILILAVAMGIALDGCKKDEKVTFSLSTLVAQSDSGPIDLNGAFAANTVPVLPTITATFNLAVDPATVTSSTIFSAAGVGSENDPVDRYHHRPDRNGGPG